jgi:diguanylate cyclase (GGDEF)-like protein
VTTVSPASHDPTPAQLLEIIRTQTEIAKLGLDLGGVMALVAERAQHLTNAAGAVVELASGEEMVYSAATGIAEKQLGLRLNRSTSLSGLCVATGSALRCDDCETDSRVDRDACRRVGLRSMIVVPLVHNGAAVGVLKVLSTVPASFGDRDRRVLELMSELIGAAMFHAVRYEADELFHRATHDGLTGLANRALFWDRLHHALAQAGREWRRVGVLILDMDGLKPLNDQHGHRAGDAALRELAARISEGARRSDTVARLGGDEFGLILSPVEDRAAAQLAAARVADRLAGSFSFEGKEFSLSASIGLAMFPDDGESADALVERADQVMYAAKREKKSGAVRAR